MFESEKDLEHLIRDSGPVCVSCNKGTFDAIFDYEFLEVQTDPPVEGRAPILTARDSELARLEIRKGSQLTIADQAYRVQRLEPDGLGITRLVLRK